MTTVLNGSERTSNVVPVVLAMLVAVAATLLWPSVATAHTGFESSTPGDGAVVDGPVDVVTIVFTGAADVVGDGIVALTPDGVIQQPTRIESSDDTSFVAHFDPPLAGGQVGIRWKVQAADAHPIEGAFAFTVDVPVTSATPPATDPPTATPPAATVPVATLPAATAAPAAPVSTVPDTVVVAVEDSASTSPRLSLDEFLEVDESTPGATTATVGRLIGFTGVAVGLGAFAFVATALRGRRDEIRHTLVGVRALGLLIALGAAIEYVGVTRVADQALTGGWSTAPGFATMLRIVGGIGLAVGIGGTISHSRPQRLMRRPSTVRSLSAAVADDLAPAATDVDRDNPIVRWTPSARSWPSIAGTGVVIVSFWFDGHTVDKGFRPLHAFVNSIHIAAGAVWVGGVVTMAAIVWNRHRSERPMRMAELVVRFSKIATIALASVVAAGVLMTILVLDSFGELTATPWGQILLLKTGAVALAMLGGAYNHFRLLPALESDPESPELIAQLRSTITAEAIMLVFVVMVTAWLVAAAS